MKRSRIETAVEGLETDDCDWVVMRVGEMAMVHVMSPQLMQEVELDVQASPQCESPEVILEAMQALPPRKQSRV